jgi:L-2-hydroxyglutarate oxidase LhgO
MMRFFQDYGIPVRTCGKVIVATSESELSPHQELYREANRKYPCELLGPSHLKEIELTPRDCRNPRQKYSRSGLPRSL